MGVRAGFFTSMDRWSPQRYCRNRQTCADHRKPAPTPQTRLNTPNRSDHCIRRKSHDADTHPRLASLADASGAGCSRPPGLGGRGRQGAWAAPRSGVSSDARQAPDYPALDDPSPDARALPRPCRRSAKPRMRMRSRRWWRTSRTRTSGWGCTSLRRWRISRPADVVPLLLVPLLRFDANGRWRSAYVLGERKEPAGCFGLGPVAPTDDEVLDPAPRPGRWRRSGQWRPSPR